MRERTISRDINVTRASAAKHIASEERCAHEAARVLRRGEKEKELVNSLTFTRFRDFFFSSNGASMCNITSAVLVAIVLESWKICRKLSGSLNSRIDWWNRSLESTLEILVASDATCV